LSDLPIAYRLITAHLAPLPPQRVYTVSSMLSPKHQRGFFCLLLAVPPPKPRKGQAAADSAGVHYNFLANILSFVIQNLTQYIHWQY